MDNKIIYVVTSGSYSDYGLDGIFDDKELAQKFSDALPDSNGVQEWVLNDTINSKVALGYKLYNVVMDKEGNSHRIYVLSVPRDGEEDPSDFPNFDFDYSQRDDKGRMKAMFENSWSFRVWAFDEKHAVKIANERRTQLIANDLWYKEIFENYWDNYEII